MISKEEFLAIYQSDPTLHKMTYVELEERFGIEPTSRKGDKVRGWIRNRSNGLTLRRSWQVNTKNGIQTLHSYENKPGGKEDLEDFRKSLIDDIREFSPERPEPLRKHSKRKLLEISIPDYHIGRTPLEVADKSFWKAFDYLTEGVHPEKIVFPVGNDWYNTDNHNYTTTRGTQQFDYNNWKETFRRGWQILASAISTLADIAPVEVIIVPGNHDVTKMFYAGDVLDAYFRNDARVTVDNSMRHFKHFHYGKNLIMYDHGEIKTTQYPLILATEFPLEFAKSEFREIHLGHFHKEMILDEIRGIKMRHLPSLAKESGWEITSGYKHTRQAQAFEWDYEAGLTNIKVFNDIT